MSSRNEPLTEGPAAASPTADAPADAVAPFGDDGTVPVAAVDVRCRCGAGPHERFRDRCANGHPRRGEAGPALIVGAHSSRFWAEHAHVRRERYQTMLRDRGHTEADAPQALRDAVDGAVQAVLLRDSAFLHVADSGGPATLSGRRRAAFNVWIAASEKALRYLQLVGLERRARPVDPLDGVFRAVEEANRR